MAPSHPLNFLAFWCLMVGFPFNPSKHSHGFRGTSADGPVLASLLRGTEPISQVFGFAPWWKRPAGLRIRSGLKGRWWSEVPRAVCVYGWTPPE